MNKRERIAEAEARASSLLADANEARERGDYARDAKLIERAGRYLDRANRLRGYGDGSER